MECTAEQKSNLDQQRQPTSGNGSDTSGSLWPPPHLKASESELPAGANDQSARSNVDGAAGGIAGYLPAAPHQPEPSQSPSFLEQEQPQSDQKLDMSSGEASFKFDALGPLVVNKDGVRVEPICPEALKLLKACRRSAYPQTLSRIHNWPAMTPSERERTLRVLGKRNQLRMDDLRSST